jgi:hypothetical protein
MTTAGQYSAKRDTAGYRFDNRWLLRASREGGEILSGEREEKDTGDDIAYDMPSPSYGMPSPRYGMPSPSVYEKPRGKYDMPSPSYGMPSPRYDMPSPSAYEKPRGDYDMAYGGDDEIDPASPDS